MTKNELIELHRFLRRVENNEVKPKISKYEIVENRVYADYLGHQIKIFFYKEDELKNVIKIFKNELNFEQFI